MALFIRSVYTGSRAFQGERGESGLSRHRHGTFTGQDPNGHWLAQFLRRWNLRLSYQLTTGDAPAGIRAALDFLYANCEVVVCSGGLGPTPDDLTKQVLADLFGKTVKASLSARSCAEANYRRLGREHAPGHGYGHLPEDFIPLDNPAGFAPGLWFEANRYALLAAPGVPKEFREMVADHWPRLLGERLAHLPPVTLLNFRTRGVPEEKIFGELCPGLWDTLAAYGEVSSLPHAMGVDVAVTLSGDPAPVRALILQSPLAPHIWHEGFESLEEVIVAEATSRGLTFGFAESCTGGMCAHRITNVPGASRVFWGSVVAYDNSVKHGILSVDEAILSAHGAVSAETALAMAQGARRRLGTDVTVALTGIAGPGGGTPEKPVGTIWLGVADAAGEQTRTYAFRGDRETLKLRFSQAGLHALLDALRATRRS